MQQSFKLLSFNFHPCKMLEQQPVDKPVAAADFLEEDETGRVIEKTSVIAGRVALDDEDQAERIVLDDIKATVP